MTAILLALALLAAAVPPSALAAASDGFAELEAEARERPPTETLGEIARKNEEDWAALSARAKADYQAMLDRIAKEREDRRRAVTQRWDEFLESTNKEWVDYDPRGEARSLVDFEKGEVEIEVLVPVKEVTGGKEKAGYGELNDGEKARLKSLAEKKLGEQAKKVVAEKGERDAKVLQGQLKSADGAPVTEKNAERYARQTLAPKMVVEEKPIVAEDGTPRIKVRVKAEMVPEHVRVRAEQFKPRVLEVSRKYGLDPALVFAVIHTESFFNPRARSQAPAFGLMQLMPLSAAREAYQFLNKKEKILSPEELYDPDTNLLLGATYLHMLHTRHFGKIKDPDNRRTVSIAAYNCGPGCVRKRVLSKGDVDAMSNAELTDLVLRAVPQETREYVPRVQGRIALYQRL